MHTGRFLTGVEGVAMTDVPGALGKYRVLEQAGQGAMGVVYLAHDPVIDRKVAVKVYRMADSAGADPEVARRLFQNEARSAGALDHPNILHIYDAGDLEGQPYIVMEYVPGGATLRQHCDPSERLPVDQVIRLTAQAARALDYAHQRGVTHRDVKPANLLLTPDGNVKIGDFGIALRSQISATQAIGAYGSPRYVAPEQARGEAASPRSDLYSLGVVLYELLAGRPPFSAGSLSTLLYKVLYEDPPPVELLRPDLPAGLAEVVRRALQKEPARRFATGQEMAEALDAVLASTVEATATPSPEQQLKALTALRFFRDFSEAEVGEVLRAGVWSSYRPGEAIVQEGVREHAFYVLVSGDAAVTKEGKEIGKLERGDCFGEMGYLTRAPRSATVVARTASVCLKVGGAVGEWASLPCQLRISRAFQQTLIERLARTSEALARQLG
jgi:serine/threonine protein kinase